MTRAKPKTSGCRVCGDPKLKSRGLCDKHYRRFLDRVASMPDDEADAFEKKCLREGWIKPRERGGRPREDDDPFETIAREVVEEYESKRQQAAAKTKPAPKDGTKERKRG